MARSSTQALLQLLIYNQRATRGLALATARGAVIDGLGAVTQDFQQLSRSVDARLSAVVDPRFLIDDRSDGDERTWSAARILQELAELRALVAAIGGLGRSEIPIGVGSGLLLALPQPVAIPVDGAPSITLPPIPAGVGGGLLLALPQPLAFPVSAAPAVADTSTIPAGTGTGLLLALPLTRSATH